MKNESEGGFELKDSMITIFKNNKVININITIGSFETSHTNKDESVTLLKKRILERQHLIFHVKHVEIPTKS